LTHDYLVPALRTWLTRKQKETLKGRAELRLAERAALWNARPENRRLPAWWEWINIRLFTRTRDWTAPQRQMMRKAGRYHAVRGLALIVALTLLVWGGWEAYGSVQAEKLVEAVVAAETADVPPLVQRLTSYRRWADARLVQHLQDSTDRPKEHLNISLALVPVDPGQVKYLYERLLDAEPHEVPIIREALRDHLGELTERLWKVVEQPEREGQRLRAACALAVYAPDDPRWAQAAGQVVEQLVTVNPAFLERWMTAMQGVRGKLLEPLERVFRDRREEKAAERSLAASILADYAADRPEVLTHLLLDADAKQFAALFPRLAMSREQAIPRLQETLAAALDTRNTEEGKEQLAKWQANAAVALLRLNRPEKAWPLLQHRPDPRARSYLIHRLSPLGADARALVKRLDEEPDVSIRRALLLSLGEFGEKDFSLEARQALLPRLQQIYGTASDPGLHAAAEWLLRTWQQEPWLKQVNAEWAREKAQRNQRLERIQQFIAGDQEKRPPQWYVNSQGQTMVVILGPVQFRMGSPATEAGRSPDEVQHQRRIGRTFAVAAKPVTAKEFRRFLRDSQLEAWFEAGGQAARLMEGYSPEEEPIILVDWWRAAAYCNWLSAQEGIPPEQWCYEMNWLLLPQHPLGAAAGSSMLRQPLFHEVTGMKKDYLRLRGYRLPTEAEWEYACRAGAVTSRSYGETEELLGRYGWYNKNSGDRPRPVGRKKPNDLGLFDMHGNVFTWCQASYVNYWAGIFGEPIEDKEDFLIINPSANRLINGDSFGVRVMRGGSFGVRAVNVRSARRNGSAPAIRDDNLGFRPARTFTP
jgi:formylglycine-generating enzyme required for sulfatase activity